MPRRSRSRSARSRSARRCWDRSIPTSPSASTTWRCSTRISAGPPRPSRCSSARSRSARRHGERSTRAPNKFARICGRCRPSWLGLVRRRTRGDRNEAQVKRAHARTIIALASLLCAAAAPAQEVRTQAPCSPVIDRTQGNVTVTFSGGCTVGIAPAELATIIDNVLARRAVPPELLDRFETVSRTFGVTDTALTTFFRILGERKVATEDLDAKLREVAARHLTLLKQAEASADDDPQVAAIKQQAVAAIGAGDYARAESLLRRAFDADLATARRAQEAATKALEIANKRFLTAAKTRADMGELDLTQLRYADAAEDFQAATDLVPAGEPLVRSRYLTGLVFAARVAGNYPLAERAAAEALSIQERILG